MQNVMIHGNSRFRAFPSQSMACLKGMGRHIAGDPPAQGNLGRRGQVGRLFLPTDCYKANEIQRFGFWRHSDLEWQHAKKFEHP